MVSWLVAMTTAATSVAAAAKSLSKNTQALKALAMAKQAQCVQFGVLAGEYWRGEESVQGLKGNK